MRIFRLRMVWERLARDDPFWAVLAAPDKAGNRWAIDEFFRTGVDEIDASLTRIDRYFPDLPRLRALDFGCGVGRLTQALGRHFREVVGVDVAARMIEQAGRYNQNPGVVRYVHNPRADLRPFAGDHFDLVLSLITLQHLPVELMEAYVREFVRVVRPGGALYFQIPVSTALPEVEIKRWSFYPPTMGKRVKRWTGRGFRRLTGLGDTMHMSCVPEARVRQWLAESGAAVVATFAHPMGDQFESLIYLARKAGPAARPASR